MLFLKCSEVSVYVIDPYTVRLYPWGKTILERLGSAQIFYSSNFPAIFSNLFCTEKSAGNSCRSESFYYCFPSRTSKNTQLKYTNIQVFLRNCYCCGELFWTLQKNFPSWQIVSSDGKWSKITYCEHNANAFICLLMCPGVSII